MLDWWTQLDLPLQIFWAIASVSSILFIFFFVLSLVGFDFEGDFEVDDVDFDGDLDADVGLFSIRSLVAFFTFFGWSGVIVLQEGYSVGIAMIAAIVAGLAAFFLVGYMIVTISKLSESGTTHIKEAISKIGEVYLSIPPGRIGKGKVHVEIDGGLKELEAITDGEALATGSEVLILDVLPDNILVVQGMEIEEKITE